jgi:alkyl sulfatase BDS1-like metallo-beta-lactamase superfamily hydrolase
VLRRPVHLGAAERGQPELLEALVDQTLEVMNRGGRLDDAIHSVRPPAGLASRPYLRPVYDEPEFVVRNVWRLYGGWWDGNPATLKPAPERALAAELAGLAGGAAALADRAQTLADQALRATGAIFGWATRGGG